MFVNFFPEEGNETSNFVSKSEPTGFVLTARSLKQDFVVLVTINSTNNYPTEVPYI